MKVFVNAVIVFLILCSGPVIFFSLGRRFFGLTKEQERDHIKRSVRNMLLLFGIVILLPSLFYLVTNFLDEVVHGPLTTGEFLRHIEKYSFHATGDLYAHIFSKMSGR